MARINLLAWDNHRGLTHDIQLLSETLTALGHRVYVTRLGPRRRDGSLRSYLLYLWMILQRAVSAGRRKHLYDVNIALEHVRPNYFGLARLNFLVPNPEWLSPHSQRYLSRFDAILCKTHCATELFRTLGYRSVYIGFSSRDLLDSQQVRHTTFLHLAGASRMKGTERLLALWQRHPEWPKLVIVQSPKTATASPISAQNIEHRVGYLDEGEEIRHLQNSHAFHLCLSETEGWGHYIVEAMGCRAVVITSDAPPMNELVDSSRGVLISASQGHSFNLATLYPFDEAALERAIDRLIDMDEATRNELGDRARSWFCANGNSFPSRLETALRQLL